MMKKKLMMVAVLLGALSLGACVENTESTSVEGVRNAKAEQLKSIATLNNANAEATLILAKADVAIKEAEAKAKQIENELKGIDLQIAQAGLTAKLEAAKVEAEAELARAQAALESAKAALIAAMDLVTSAEKARVQTLLGKADEVLGRIDANRQALIDAKFAKAGLEAGLEGVKATKEKTIIAQNRIIATSEALIVEYGKYNLLSKVEAEKAADEADAKKSELEKVNTAFNNAKNAAIASKDAAKKLVDESVYLKNATSKKSEAVLSYTEEYTNNDGTYGACFVDAYTKYTADKAVMQTAVNKVQRDLDIAKSIQKDATKALAEVKASEEYKNAIKAETDARKAYNAALSSTTATTADKEQRRQELDAAEVAVKAMTQGEEQAVKNATDNVNTLTADLVVVTNQLAAVNDNEDEYNTLVAAWETAIKAATTATIAANKAGYDYGVQSTLATSLRGIATATADIATLVLTEKGKIADAKAVIAEYQSVADEDEAIELKAREITKLEQKLKIDEAVYADYMAQIKALIEAGK